MASIAPLIVDFSWKKQGPRRKDGITEDNNDSNIPGIYLFLFKKNRLFSSCQHHFVPGVKLDLGPWQLITNNFQFNILKTA